MTKLDAVKGNLAKNKGSSVDSLTLGQNDGIWGTLKEFRAHSAALGKIQ